MTEYTHTPICFSIPSDSITSEIEQAIRSLVFYHAGSIEIKNISNEIYCNSFDDIEFDENGWNMIGSVDRKQFTVFSHIKFDTILNEDEADDSCIKVGNAIGLYE